MNKQELNKQELNENGKLNNNTADPRLSDKILC